MNLFGAPPSEVKTTMLAEKTRRVAECRRRNDFFAIYDDLYYLQHYGKKSPGKITGKIGGKSGVLAQSNDATNQINVMRQLIGVKDLHIKVYPRWISGPELEAGSEIERWLWAVLEANNDRQENEVLDLILFDTLRLGWGVAYSRWDQDTVARSIRYMPSEQGNIPIMTECPIVIEKISPYLVYPESGGHQGRWRSFLVVEKDKNAMEVAQEWGKAPRKLREEKFDRKHLVTVDYIVYWGWERIEGQWYVVCCAMADDEIMYEPTIMQGYDSLPITLFFCHPTGDSRWEFMSLSVLFAMHLDVLLLDRLMNRLHRQVDQFTNMPLTHKKPRSGEGSSIDLPTGLFNIVELESDEDFKSIQWPGNPPDVHILLNLERQKIREAGISPEMAASPESGIALSRRWAADLVKTRSPTRAYERGLKSLLNKVKSLAVNFGGELPISLITNYPKASGNVILSGSALAPYTLGANLTGELPMDEFRKLNVGLQFAQLPPQLRPFSQATLMERFLDIEQPEEEYEKMLQDMARQSKAVQLIQTYQYLLSKGYSLDISFLAQIEGTTGGAPPTPQGGMPPLPQRGEAPGRRPREMVSTALSPYETGISTVAQEEAPPGEMAR